MGTDFEDYDNDGWEDVYVTALAGETFPLFKNDGHGAFVETTQASGLAAATVKTSGWCTVLADADNDGWKDIFTANSHVNDRIGDFQSIQWKQPNSLFINGGQGDNAIAAGATRRRKPVSRVTSRFTGDAAWPTSTATAVSTSWSWSSAGSGAVEERNGIGPSLADRPAHRHQEQPRRHRSASQDWQSGADDDDVDGVRVVVTCRTALWPGNGGGSRDIEVQWPSGIKQTVESVKTNQVVEIKEK